ncbi:MAG TPA: isoaspartyl peptidase/L-asparaginase [Stenomitos sp.]
MNRSVAIVVHGGVGNSPANADGCMAAAEAGMRLLRAGRDSLEATLAAAVLMEDDERFNAGTGSSLGLDGRTISMDAGLMDTRGRLGAVAALQQVKNPILVAREVADTPHWLLVGEGATAFARVRGFPSYYRVTERAQRGYARVLAALLEKTGGDFPSEWHQFDLERYWNFQTSWQEILNEHGHGTIGAVARDADGHFAVCNSTGGSSPMLYGRVGDSPIMGSGFYAGPAGAVAATGIGEYIVRKLLCRTVYGWLEADTPLAEALERGVRLFAPEIAVGLIAVTAREAGACNNRQMPVAQLTASLP